MSDTLTGDAQKQLKRYIERIVNVEDDIAELNADKSRIYKAAKADGFDPKMMREALRIYRKDKVEREQFESMRAVYLHALGLEGLAGTPLGEAAVERAQAEEADKPNGEAKRPSRARASGKLRRQVKEAFGEPVELTDEERAAGVTAAFEKDGQRVSMGFHTGVDIEAAEHAGATA